MGKRAQQGDGNAGPLLEQAVRSVLTAPEEGLDLALDTGASLLAASAGQWPAVSRALLGYADTAVGRCWSAGWRPADLVRVVRRGLKPVHLALAVDLIAAEARRHPAAGLDRRWLEQLRELEAEVWWPSDEQYLGAFAHRHRLDRFALATAVLELLRSWGRLPPIAPVGPAPGASTAARRPTGPVTGEPRMLARIRALLAKAESTEYPEEAEALTAKAQQLMAQHSIDEALVAAAAADRNTPAALRIGVDNPYEGPKTMLLDAVAAANRCRVVWAKEFGFCTVIGFDGDLDGVELLYTSLLVQATHALNKAGSGKDSRSKAFRQSFLVAYAARIRERLTAATERTTTAAAAGRHLREDGTEEQLLPDARLLPALAARSAAVDEEVGRLFPKLVSQRVRVSDGEGWAAGRAAADRAALHGRGEIHN
ncbi:DUF2786 domain-containing protein [Kitasatospora aureofaciens]|uniref:Uncharacterized protein n=1 Tax=Kitasatospora aureofaciens TaxID=1894 RepID=A0A1E7NAC9_KITAU|nr:DUF2786 domain-containing protein [Kitasatospora aureofaciens]ARF79911.1 hypothetical protein B6264_14260 [Kitasatospora aureofaciens]OEV37655.1 hypothetical protein HS99_0025470 [Kitasatospora aureofaciens]GGU90984.1 hypothetical protein GCM10010502_50230 [Kitasatospora aureofaciens]